MLDAESESGNELPHSKFGLRRFIAALDFERTMAKKKSAAVTASIPVEGSKHQNTRKNIPTEELRDFGVR